MKTPSMVIAGIITLIVGLLFVLVASDIAATNGEDAIIGSFAGVRALNDLIPLIMAAMTVLLAATFFVLGFRGK